MNSSEYNVYFDNMDMFDNLARVFGGFFGIFLILGLIIFIVGLALAICVIIGKWKAFKKAGKEGWEAIIPIYNQVVLCQISGVNPWWVLISIVGCAVLQVIPGLGQIAALALSIYFYVILYVSAARSFGKSDAYAAGLYFLAPIFWLLVGGKNTEYVGAKPMKDVVWEFVDENILKRNNSETKQPENTGVQQTEDNDIIQSENKETENNDTNNNEQQIKFCTSCGSKITSVGKFCPECGEKIQNNNEVI